MVPDRWILAGVLAFLTALSSFGGALGDRNKAVAERSEKKKADENNQPAGSNDGIRSSFGSGTYPSSEGSSGFLTDMWSWLIIAPFAYRSDDPSASMNSGEGEDGWAESGSPSLFPRHEPGQATVPYIRADVNLQAAEDVDATDVRIEGGYKLIGLQGRFTRYLDDSDEELNIRQYYLMLRYGGYRPDFARGTFEAAVGLGIAHHSGSSLSNYGLEDDSSGALTFSLKYYPYDWIGVEFRPAWWRFYDLVHGDYDLSVSAGYTYVQFRGGYRWVWENGVGIVDALSGPYAGVSISF